MLTLRVRPRLEINKWNLYHNSTVATKTILLDDLELSVPETMKVKEFSETAWEQIGHVQQDPNIDFNLNGRDRVLNHGLQISDDSKLDDYAFEPRTELVIVRQVFMLESELIFDVLSHVTHFHAGWKIISEYTHDSSTDEEDF